MLVRSCSLLLLLSLTSCSTDIVNSAPSFTIDWGNNTFLKDGQPYRFISGGMHYFRVPMPYWKDRMYKMKLAGMNALQTYVAWNIHETVEGQYHFKGDQDLLLYLDTAKDMGLDVILRPGPYICAEWSFGGLPFWLLNKEGIVFREYSEPYIAAINAWFDVLLPKLVPYLHKNGGPIIAVQVENEYGGFGLTNVCDHKYLRFLLDKLKQYFGEDIVYYTVDNGNVKRLECGGLPELLKTIDFGSNKIPHFQFEMLRKYMPKGPLVNTEFWSGWFDVWGGQHANVSAELIADRLDQILALNASVNFYMFEGGTNFGYMNGAMSKDGYKYNVRVTSYDYDSPLTEAGDTNPKYWAIRKVMKKYVTLPSDPVPAHSKKWSTGPITVAPLINVFNNLTFFTNCSQHTLPVTMEQFNQSQGFMLYSLPWNSLISSIALYGVHDRALVYLDSVLYGNIMRPNGTLALLEPTSVTLVQILVENLGRVNHGSYMGQDFKGLTKSVVIDGEDVTSKVWSVCPLELDTKHDFPDYPPHYKGAYPPHYSPYYSPRDLTRLAKLAEDESIPYYNGKQYETEAYPDYQTDEDQSAKPEPQTERVAVTEQEHQSTPNQQEPQSTPNQREPKLGVYTPSFYCSFIPKYQNTHSLDTFLDPTGWGKGVLFLNGINIGRYWPSEGPQVTLYVPGVWFSSEQHQGKSNLLCLLELEKPSDSLTVRFVDKPQLSLPATKAG